MLTDFTDQEKIHREAFECPSDMLAAIWRPDGDQICTSNLAGKLMFWCPKTSTMTFEIDASRDMRAGRPKNSKVSAETLTDQGFNQLCYSSDGEYLLAGGKSFLVVMYSVRARHVIGTFILSQNMNIDGLAEFLNAKNTMTEFGALAEIDDDEQVKIAGQKKKDRAIRRVEVFYKIKNKKSEAKLRVKISRILIFDEASRRAFLLRFDNLAKFKLTLNLVNFSLPTHDFSTGCC